MSRPILSMPLIFILARNERMVCLLHLAFTILSPCMAASVVALVPVLAVFLALQKYFVEGVAASGLKG